MVRVSIACLIYKSVRWLKFVYEQVQKYTDLSENEFYFVANDANEQVLNYLKDNNIPHYIHTNTEEQQKEWYINNVYRAWNTAAKKAKGEYIVFINSDMAFSPGWLTKLQSKIKDNTVISSRLVERGILRSGTYGIERTFGDTPETYKENEFISYVDSISENKVCPGGLYMPLLIKKTHIELIGYYPEGNICTGSDIFNPRIAHKGQALISGDVVFIQKLAHYGIKHETDFSSIIYHFQQGEMLDSI